MHLANAVRLVTTADALLSPVITRRLVERFTTESAPVPPHHDLSPLTGVSSRY